MSMIEVNFADYVRGVRASAQQAVALAARLQWAAPADLMADEKRALKLVQQRAEEVTAVLGDRDRMGPARVRALLGAFGNDWGALYGALTSKAKLHESKSGKEAQAICDSLFPDGLSFTQLEADAAWVEGHRRLDRIEKEDFASKITHLVGSEFIAAVQKSTGELGNTLGTGRVRRTTPSTTALSEALTRFGKAVGAYGRLLAAHVDEDDEASMKRFLAAVEPLDAHRANRAGGSDGTDTEGEDVADATPAHPAEPTTPTAPTSHGGTPAPAHATSNGSTPAPGPITNASPTSNGTTPAPAPVVSHQEEEVVS